MKTLRAGWRLLLVAKTTAFFYALVLAGTAVVAFAPRQRIRWRDFCFRNWSRWVLAILHVTVEHQGTPPRPPFFLVANHLSYIDILVLASHVDAVFIAKSEVRSWPIIGLLCRSVGTLFVDRGSRRDIPRVIAEIDRVLGHGQGIVLFPEGTSTPGFEVGRFRPSLLEVAARAGIPVSHASLSYDTGDESKPAHLTVCWWGDMEFPGHFWRLLALPRFTAKLSFGRDTIQDDDRKRLADRLQAAVERQFVPVVSEGAPTEAA